MPETIKKILIVEDEGLIAKVLAKKLQLAGFAATNVYNGHEALTKLGKEKFDLILLDLLMPRVDGFAVLAELKKRGDMTPVIVATNLNQEKDVSRVLEMGVTGYYVKSDTTLDEIVENIKATLEKKQ